MKKIIIAVLALAIIVLNANAQVSMRIEMKDGQQLFFPISTIKQVTWVTDESFSDTLDASHSVVKAVDLGLPSGIKWANVNIGAKSPEDYGWYLAWGETEPKSDYSMDTYFDSRLVKYSISIRPTLVPEDDAAHVNWGGDWRIPTAAEHNELRSYCTWTWATLNGVKGFKVSSKTNGNFIFLPAAGCRRDSYLGDAGAGSYGYYWSSSVYSGGPYGAYYLSFSASYIDQDYFSRYYGRSVRAVCP